MIASTKPCSHHHKSENGQEEEKKEFLDVASFLEAQFGPVELHEKDRKIVVNVDGVDATVDTLKFVSFEKKSFVAGTYYCLF